MKRQILIFLLAILTLILFSCNTVEVDNEKDSQTIAETEREEVPQTDTDTETPSSDTETIDTVDCVYPASYSLQYSNMVILEIGEICELEYVPSEYQPEYVGVGVNIVKDFEETFNRPNYEEKRLQRKEFVVAENRERIFDEYDDVIVIEASMIDEIPVGMTVFAPLFGESLEGATKRKSAYFFEIRPLLLFTERNDSIYGFERVLELMYVIDGKISVPERIKKGADLPYREGNILIYAFEEANRNLVKVGRKNQLFYDGMTIEELKNYIRTASNEFWFRSLHENEGN